MATSIDQYTPVFLPGEHPSLTEKAGRPQSQFSSIQFSSVAQLCLTLCDPMDHSTPGLPVHHQLLEFTQTHIHRVGDAIQPSHLLPSPSPPALNLSQHHSLFQRVNSLHEVAKVLEFQLQHQSFQWIFRTDFLLDGLVGSPCSPRDSQESSPTSQFKNISSLALRFLYSPTLTSIHDQWKIHSLIVFIMSPLCPKHSRNFLSAKDWIELSLSSYEAPIFGDGSFGK